jgi:hypothetical protein
LKAGAIKKEWKETIKKNRILWYAEQKLHNRAGEVLDYIAKQKEESK